MDLSLILALLALGAVVGFVAGLLGIGGGLLLTPCFTFLLASRGVAEGRVVHMAVATSLATIVFTSLAALRAHHQRGAVAWRVVGQLTPGLLVGSWLGPWLARKLDAAALGACFVVFVLVAAGQMLVDVKPAASRDLPAAPGMFAAGGIIGVLAGLVGVGGAFASVPFMTWCNVTMHTAVATSAALAFPIAASGTLSNVFYGLRAPGLPPGSLGFVWLPGLVCVSAASVVTAPLGAWTAYRLPVTALRRAFAVFLLVLAARMLYTVLR
jgi:uncharacterized membrane protein YfcA